MKGLNNMNNGFWSGVLFVLGFTLETTCYAISINKFGVEAFLCVFGGCIGTLMYSNALRK